MQQREQIRLDLKTSRREDGVLGRDSLQPRPDPYYMRIRRHFALGLRVTVLSSYWCARWDKKGKREHETLGEFTEQFGYTQALEKAEQWLTDLLRGVRAVEDGKPVTVAYACNLYADTIELERPAAAKEARRRFVRHLLGGTTQKGTYARHPLADVELSKLAAYELLQWRDGMVKVHGKSKQNANRVFCDVKAAIRMTVGLGKAPSRVSAEVCSQVQKFEDASERREVYLNLAQRRVLLKACEGDVRDLVEGCAHTGARVGELANMRRKHFDPVSGTAHFNGKTGLRKVPLSPAAVTFFKRLSRGKLPEAFMFTLDGDQWKATQWGYRLKKVRTALMAAVPALDTEEAFPADVVMYTLRHCFITDALMHGKMSTLEVARITGTSLAQIEEHYGHLVNEVARERLAGFAML